MNEDYRDIGYEAAWPEYDIASQVYSILDLELISKFTHLQNSIHESESILANGNHQVMTLYWKPEATPDKPVVILRANERVIFEMKTTAFNMYREYFLPSPKMKEMADYVIETYWEDKRNAKTFEIGELDSLWDQS